MESQERTKAVILIMGATGTGKSTFINLLTGDNKIHIGHSQQSETFGVEMAHFVDQETRRPVQLIDTPGFDDSRDGVTDIDILEKIARFLVPESGEKIDITGIIYMHRISDPRVGGVSRKNIKMFYALCGEKNLNNVRVVTTNWSRVTEDEGNHREADLKNGAFKAFVDAGAQMRRHTNNFDSAQQIVSELISLPPVTLAIQEEVRDGKKLVDTGAGMVLEAEMQAMKKKHEQELADLEKEMRDTAEEQDRSLRAELEQERETLREKMKRANADRERLESTLAAAHTDASETSKMGEELPKDRHRATDRSSGSHIADAEAHEQGDPAKPRERNEDGYGGLHGDEHRVASQSLGSNGASHAAVVTSEGLPGPMDTEERNASIAEMEKKYTLELADRYKEIARLKEEERGADEASSVSRDIQALEDRIRDMEKKRAEAALHISDLWGWISRKKASPVTP